jgi:hypothetical protein
LAFLTSLPFVYARQTSPPLQKGYIRVIPDAGTTSPAGLAVFGLRSGGVLITEAGVQSTTTTQSGRVFVDIAGSVNTGIAMVNPNDQDATISYYFTGSGGNNFGAGTFTLPANHQIATFFSEAPFAVTSLTGTFTFSASLPVAALALRNLVNQRNEVLITTMPVSPVGTSFGGTTLVFPVLDDSRRWNPQVVLVNPGDTPLSGNVRFYGVAKNGYSALIKVSANGTVANTFNYSIPPRSVFRLSAQRAGGSGRIGSVRVNPSGSGLPSAMAVLAYQNGTTTVSTASVVALPGANAVRMYAESSGTFGQQQSIQTALSIANRSSSRVTAQVELYNLDGTPAGSSTTVSVPAGGQIARFVSELFPQLPSPFRGAVRVTAPSPLVAAGLRGKYNERGELLMTATPPYDESTPPLPRTEFPHFVTGDGYSTQLILLSTGPAHAGSLQLLSQEGVPLPSFSLTSSP